MTVSSTGYPMPIGLTLKLPRSQTLPLHGNGFPKKFVFKLENGKPTLYSVLNTVEEMNKGNTPINLMKYMEIPITSVKTNVPLLKVFSGTLVLFNFELKCFGSLVGTYDLTTDGGNLLPTSLFLIEQAMPALLEELKIDYGVPNFDFSVFSSGGEFIITKITRELIVRSIQGFVDFIKDYIDMDISIYPNTLASCISSLDSEITWRYTDESYTGTDLHVGNKLSVIDPAFMNRLDTNVVMNTQFNEMIESINETLHLPLDTLGSTLPTKIKDIAKQIAREVPSNFKPEYFILDFMGRMSGLINLAITFGIMKSGKIGATNGLYFAFAYPEKFTAQTEN